VFNGSFYVLVMPDAYSRLIYYLRQGGYVFIGVSWLVSLLAGLRKNYSADFHKIRQKGGTWTKEEFRNHYILVVIPDHVTFTLSK